MPAEIRAGSNGIPYVVEFANVSIWPRRPETPCAEGENHSSRKPSALLWADKPLPALPPTRSSSIKRIFKRRQSEPAPRATVNEDWQNTPRPIRRHSATTCSRAERDEKIRNPLATLSIFSLSEETLVGSNETSNGHVNDTPPYPTDAEMISQNHVLEAAIESPICDRASDMDTRSGGLFLTFREDASGKPHYTASKNANTRLRHLSRAIAEAVAAAGMISPPARTADQQQQQACTEAVNVRKTKSSASGPCGKSLFKGTYGQVRTAFHTAGLMVKKCNEEGFEGGACFLISIVAPRVLTRCAATRIGILFVANHDRDGNVIFTKIVLYGS
jgi:hypothetical protein